MANDLLLLQDLSKSFGGLKAVQGVSLAVPEGSLTALIGPNGAGKTTLFALMSGFIRPDTGTVRFAGHDITGQAPHLNARRGMTRTFQIEKDNYSVDESGTFTRQQLELAVPHF